MIKVRRGVFETNSSSTHSICITKSDLNINFPESITFSVGDFGWEEDKLFDHYEKASYLYTAIMCLYDKKEQQKFIDFIVKTLDKNNIDYRFVPIGSEYYGIDHCSELREVVELICHSEKRLLRYLFSEESFILTGNDNNDSCVEINVTYKHETYYKGN